MPFITDRLAAEGVAVGGQASGHSESRPTDAEFAKAAVGRVDAARILAQLRANVFGQDHAIESIFKTLSVVQAGLTDKTRPLASHLLVGPTGTGKTEIVRQLASALRTGPDDFCQVDMSAMAQEHYAASFAGAPPGYSGSKEGLSVFDRDRIEGTVSMPGIVLFDEVEKAHTTVLRALLHVLDRGQLTLANGQQRYDFRNCLVFMTSNLGSRELRAEQERPWHRAGRSVSRLLPAPAGERVDRVLEGRLDRISEQSIARFFDPEFLNRIDEVTLFEELSQDTAVEVARHELEMFADRARKRGVDLTIDDAVAAHLVETGFDPVYGARSVRRAIRHDVWPMVAEAVIAHRAARMADTTSRVSAVLVVDCAAVRCRVGGPAA
ncbi:AAA family ATPase [Tsukamurella sp. M9C]|uniref:AAA family ATPase n=1 Tax=Tsukamurella sp. M9C TaxID=2877520 RepID=UPI001CC98942|nr:AAA family ATPase [Tsukamurella sp. M9C]MCA0156500.1 AAA family ATPase [Tsukamurella sp. M9C]